jgi:predicted PurR-regulated permease PerM
MVIEPKPSALEPATPPPAEPVGERRRLSRVRTFSDLVVAISVVLAACYFAKLPIVVLLVSILISFILAPVVDLLQKARLPRGVAALLAVLLLMAAIYGIVHASYNRAQQFAQQLPQYSSDIRKAVGRHVYSTSEAIQKTTSGVLGEPPQARPAPQISWTNLLSQNLGPITEVVLATSFIPFLVYFLLTWQEHARAATVRLFRTENQQTAYVALGLISSMIRSFIVGNLIVGLFMSAISTGVFALLHLPYFYFLGFISGFLSLVPYLGVLLAMAPPLIAGIGHIHSTQAAIIVVTVLSLHLFAINVLYPKFLGSRLQLNPLTVTLALLFWGWLWGAMGLILAIPITAALKIVFDHVEHLRPYGAWLGNER